MRLAFMGTPDFAVPTLGALLAAGHDVVAVYTRPPRPAGRGKRLTRSPIHQFADEQGLSVRSPKSFKSVEEREAFAALDLDAGVVVAYGLILPQAVLDAPRLGCFNLHASLLPRWRGAAPIQRAIMAGDEKTGVEVMRMEAGLDTGPVLLSETLAIGPDDTAGSLHDRLAAAGADLMLRALGALERGTVCETPQAEDGATYADKITSQETRIDWSRPAREIDCFIRGLSPFPSAWFEFDAGKGRVRVRALFSQPANGEGQPGEILEAGERLVVACGEGAVELARLQRAGKATQNAADFLRGLALEKGQRL